MDYLNTYNTITYPRREGDQEMLHPQLTPPPTPESADDIPLQKGSEPTPSTSNTKPPRGRPPPLYDDICREDLLPTYDKSSEYIKHSLAACVNGKIHPNFGGDYLAYRKRFGGLI